MGSYIVKEAIEFTNDKETSYFIAAENEKQMVVLRVGDRFIEQIKVTKK